MIPGSGIGAGKAGATGVAEGLTVGVAARVASLTDTVGTGRLGIVCDEGCVVAVGVVAAGPMAVRMLRVETASIGLVLGTVALAGLPGVFCRLGMRVNNEAMGARRTWAATATLAFAAKVPSGAAVLFGPATVAGAAVPAGAGWVGPDPAAAAEGWGLPEVDCGSAAGWDVVDGDMGLTEAEDPPGDAADALADGEAETPADMVAAEAGGEGEGAGVEDAAGAEAEAVGDGAGVVAGVAVVEDVAGVDEAAAGWPIVAEVEAGAATAACVGEPAEAPEAPIVRGDRLACHDDSPPLSAPPLAEALADLSAGR